LFYADSVGTGYCCTSGLRVMTTRPSSSACATSIRSRPLAAAPFCLWRCGRHQLGNGDATSSDHDPLSFPDQFDQLREARLRLVHVHLNH
jgi:hypothetical protein